MSKYVLIPNIKVSKINALVSYQIVSPLPIFAASMLGFALGDDVDAPVESVAYIHHDFEMKMDSLVDGKKKIFFPHQFRSGSYIDMNDYVGKTMSLSLQPSFLADITISLVLKIKNGFSPSKDEIFDSIKNRKLAGGVINSVGKIQIFDSFSQVQKFLKSGFIVLDSTFDMGVPEQGEKVLKKFIDFTHKKQEENFLNESIIENSAQEVKNNIPKDWISATVLGYFGITPISKERKGVRDNHPHCFVEPAVGVVKLKTLRAIPENIENIDEYFWHRKWVDETTFIVTTNNLI